MKDYDYIIAGAGCSGLSLVFHLLNSSLASKNILLIDKTFSNPQNKTWCYWHSKPLPIHPPGKEKGWKNFVIQKVNEKVRLDLQDLNYFHINSTDFNASMDKMIENRSNVTKLEDEVLEIIEKENGVVVRTASGKEFYSDYSFDSRLNSTKDFNESVLKQIFSGWKIETNTPVFDPNVMTLMDFSQNSTDAFEFIYILPFSANSALVEFTTYAKNKVSTKTLDAHLKSYLQASYGPLDYQISYREEGVIPMTTKIIQSSHKAKIISIGTKAGWTKASTGYTFQTIQKHCEQIVQNLESGIHPNHKISKSSRFNFYDNILLNIATKAPSKLQSVFMDMFKNVRPRDILRFLNEETQLLEEIRILSKLKFKTFIQSLLRYERH